MKSLIFKFDVSRIEDWDSEKSTKIRYDLILKQSSNGHWSGSRERRGQLQIICSVENTQKAIHDLMIGLKHHWIYSYLEATDVSPDCHL